MIYIYTDGSCLKNPGGVGGWACCIVYPDNIEIHLMGNCISTTNNRMELQAVIEAIRHISCKEECTVVTDSMLTINCASGKWKRNMNIDLWEEYDIVSKGKKISFEWVKGHSGNKYNELVDKIANTEARKLL